MGREYPLSTEESCTPAGGFTIWRMKSPLRAAGSASSATWTSRCMRRAWVTTAPVRASWAAAATSRPLRRFRPVRRLRGAAMRRRAGAISATASIMEIGAGSGRLAADILSRLETLGAIAETLSDARGERRLARAAAPHARSERAPHLLPLVQWLDAPPTESFDGVILANEVLDALPVSRFRWNGTHCEELGVVIWQRPASAGRRVRRARRSPRLAPRSRRPAADGRTATCRSTVRGSRRGRPSVTRALGSGVALWFDYGLPRAQYYFPERRDGTLMCHFRHRAHDDPFLLSGSARTSPPGSTSLRSRRRAGPAGCRARGLYDAGAFPGGLGDRPRDAGSRRPRCESVCAPRQPGAAADAAGRDGRAFQGDGVVARNAMRRCAASSSRTCGTRCSGRGGKPAQTRLRSTRAGRKLRSRSSDNCSRTAAIACTRRRCSCSAILAPERSAMSSADGLINAAARRAASR